MLDRHLLVRRATKKKHALLIVTLPVCRRRNALSRPADVLIAIKRGFHGAVAVVHDVLEVKSCCGAFNYPLTWAYTRTQHGGKRTDVVHLSFPRREYPGIFIAINSCELLLLLLLLLLLVVEV